MKVNHRRLPFSLIEMMDSPGRQSIRDQSKVAATCNWYVTAKDTKRRRRKLTYLPPTFQPLSIRKTWGIRNAVIVVYDGKYTGIVLKSFLTEDFKSPKGLGSNRIAWCAETRYRHSRDILYNLPRSPHVVAEVHFVAFVNQPMGVPVTPDAVAGFADRLDQPWKPLCHPTQDKKRPSNLPASKHFQQSERIALNSTRIALPIG